MTMTDNQSHEQSARLERGMEKLKEIHGAAGENAIKPMGDLGRLITEFAFGDVYTRPGLAVRERQMLTVGMLSAMGGREAQLKVHLNSALNLGITQREIEEIIIQSALYGGFPAAMSAMACFNQVLSERQ
jgi:4-carboxymuconolactone decarboxylase